MMVNLDDIVFENRNKSYGAYAIRRAYNTHMLAGGMVVTAMVTAAVLLTYITTDEPAYKEIIIKDRPENIAYTLLPVPPQVAPEVKKIKKPKPPPAARKLKEPGKSVVLQQTKKVKPSISPPAPVKIKKPIPPISKVFKKIKQEKSLRNTLKIKEPVKPCSVESAANNIAPGIPAQPGDAKLKERKISLHLKDVSIRQALKIIEKQAGVHFVYSRNYINITRKITIDADDRNLLEVLEELLAPAVIKYITDVDDFIVLVPDD